MGCQRYNMNKALFRGGVSHENLKTQMEVGMKKLKSLIKRKHVIVLSAFACSLVLLQLAPAARAETGGGQSIYDSTYIDKLESGLKSLIQSTREDLQKQITASSSQADLEKKLSDTQKELAALKESMVFKVVKLPAGKILLGGNSTEIILRTKSGATAYIEKTASGGLSNLISGKDHKNGEVIPDNQLLLVPNGDGRGIKASKESYIMVKGEYTIK